jgi:hypothetical protein
MRRLLVLLSLTALVVAGCSDDDSASGFLDKCIRYNERLTEAQPVDCGEKHIGKVIAVVEADKDCAAPATSQFGMGRKKLCIDNQQ